MNKYWFLTLKIVAAYSYLFFRIFSFSLKGNVLPASSGLSGLCAVGCYELCRL